MDPALIKTITPYIVPIIVVAIMARRLMRNPARKVKTGRIFLLPAVVVIATAATLWSAPMPSPWLMWILVDVLALLAGLATGFFTAHHQEFALDYETGTITSKTTPLGTILVAALFAARFGLKFIFPDINGSPYSAVSYAPGSPIPSAPHHGAAAFMGWTDAGLIFSHALLFARAATTWLRAQPLIAEHKAHLAAKETVSPP